VNGGNGMAGNLQVLSSSLIDGHMYSGTRDLSPCPGGGHDVD
jgi:hypothetical protein